MNQEKIGKFIKELRIEKKLTQQDLALKLNVSDKAISKWENGRCLMDVSLLKPLSEILEVSIVEILSGERIESDNIFDKSNEVVENTLDYSKEEIRKNKIKIIASICIFIFIILNCIYFGYKGLNLYRYSTSEWVNKEIKNPYNFDKVYKVYKKTIPEEEYITIKNVKIKNIIGGYIINDDTYLDSNRIFSSTYFDSISEDSFSVGITVEYLLSSGKDFDFDAFQNPYYPKYNEFLLVEDINDTIDLYTYFAENGYKYSNIFTSVEDMKLNRYYNKQLEHDIMLDIEYRYLIDGDYKGIIYKEIDSDKIYVLLTKNELLYSFVFDIKGINIDYVLDIVSTIEIR